MPEAKLNERFLAGQFLINGYRVIFCSDRDGNGGGILLDIREDITSKLLPVNQNTGFFFRRNKSA